MVNAGRLHRFADTPVFPLLAMRGRNADLRERLPTASRTEQNRTEQNTTQWQRYEFSALLQPNVILAEK